MSLIEELARQYKTLSIIGMAKNAGKTTTLNYLIEEAGDAGLALGVTSTGRDGENTDLVTGTEKPKVFLDVGTIVSVPTGLYEMSFAGLEILQMTGYHTTLGELMLCRVAESGYVQIAGPLNVRDHKKLCGEMLSLGAELILIDGAVDRKSIAEPGASDAIILATGAVLSRNMKKVVEETMYVANLYGLPKIPEGELRSQLKEKRKRAEGLMVRTAGQWEVLDLKTGLLAGRFLDEAIRENTDWVYIPGALTPSVVGDIHPAKLKQVTFALKDPTRIFLGAGPWQQLRKKGFRVQVLENIEIAAITVNPYSPAGYSFDHEDLLTAMRDAAGTIPVLDVKK